MGPEGFTRLEIERIYRERFVDGNHVEILSKGREAFRRIFDAVSGAERFVCLEFYIFRNDKTGGELARILRRKAGEGVRVCMLYDHFGSMGTPRSFWKGLKEAGVSVGASYVFKLAAPLKYVHRDHRKLIIVDHHTAFTGGLNVADEYRDGFHIRYKQGWRDTGVLIKGPVVCVLHEGFKKAWRLWGKGEITFTCAPREPAGALSVMPVFAGSGRGRRRLRRLLYYSINHARESIMLTTAYFSPSRRLVEIIEGAARRGVRVRMLLPGLSDMPAAYYAGRAYYERLLEAGVEIFHYMGQVLHAKSYVFDGRWSIVGSANLDFQSLRWNDEGNVGILDEGFAGMLTKLFEEDVEGSERIRLEDWRKRSLWGRLKERFFSMFRKRL